MLLGEPVILGAKLAEKDTDMSKRYDIKDNAYFITNTDKYLKTCSNINNMYVFTWSRGYSHVLKDIQGYAAKMGRFLQEIPKHGPHFHENISNYGSDSKNFGGLHSEPWKIIKIWCVPVAKLQGMGTFFGKIPKHG